MIAEKSYICIISRDPIKKFITPSLRPFRALFFLLFLLTARTADFTKYPGRQPDRMGG